MDNTTFRISLAKNPDISINVTPGHFSTGTYHTNFYLDLSEIRTDVLLARDVAQELAIPYLTSTLVDAVVCMENTNVIGAFLAEELSHHGMAVMNSGGHIHVVTPKSTADRKLIFYDNEIDWIENKNILLLTSTISSGQTLVGALECIEYYHGIISGVSSLYSTSVAVLGQKTYTLFSSEDIPGYRVVRADKCDMCLAEQELDAIVNYEGYIKV